MILSMLIIGFDFLLQIALPAVPASAYVYHYATPAGRAALAAYRNQSSWAITTVDDVVRELGVYRGQYGDPNKIPRTGSVHPQHTVDRAMACLIQGHIPDVTLELNWQAILLLREMANDPSTDPVMRYMSLRFFGMEDRKLNHEITMLNALGEAYDSLPVATANQVTNRFRRQLALNEHITSINPQSLHRRYRETGKVKMFRHLVEDKVRPNNYTWTKTMTWTSSLQEATPSRLTVGPELPPDNVRNRFPRGTSKRGTHRAEDVPVHLGLLEGLAGGLPAAPTEDDTPTDSSTPKAVEPLFPGGSVREFAAYNCQQPQDLEAVRPPSHASCHRERPIVAQEDKTILLMQEVPHLRIAAKKCAARWSSIPLFCGNYDHQTVLTSDIRLNRPLQIHPDDCRGYHRDRKYVVVTQVSDDETNTREFDLVINATNQLSYDQKGKTWLDTSEVQCTGAEYYSRSAQKNIENVVEWSNIDLSLDEEPLMVDKKGKVVAFMDQRSLPEECSPSRGECVMNDATYVWTPPHALEECRLFVTRRLSGKIVTTWDASAGVDGESISVFIDDERMVRLVLTGTASRCERPVRTTDYDNLFVYEDADDPDFKDRLIDPKDVSLHTYGSNRDAWLANYFQDSFETYVQGLLVTMCEERLKEDRQQYALATAEQMARKTGETISLGGGLFATSAGEVFHRYRCEPLPVYGIDLDKCFDALPVALQPQDKARYLAVERKKRKHMVENGHLKETDLLPLTDLQLYLEPMTRRLTSLARERPCLLQLAPVYENTAGQHIMACPALIPVPTPRTLQTPNLRHDWRMLKEEDGIQPQWSTGGIYTADTLQAYDAIGFAARIRESNTIDLNEQNPSGMPLSTAARQHYFRTDMNLLEPDEFGWIRGIWKGFVTVSYVMAIVSGVGITLGMCNYCCNLCTNCLFSPKDGWGKAVYKALCPAIANFYYGFTAWKSSFRPSSIGDSTDADSDDPRGRHVRMRRIRSSERHYSGDECSDSDAGSHNEKRPRSILKRTQRAVRSFRRQHDDTDRRRPTRHDHDRDFVVDVEYIGSRRVRPDSLTTETDIGRGVYHYASPPRPTVPKPPRPSTIGRTGPTTSPTTQATPPPYPTHANDAHATTYPTLATAPSSTSLPAPSSAPASDSVMPSSAATTDVPGRAT